VNSNGNQSNAEMREYFHYKRQLHTNMTQRVLNKQEMSMSKSKGNFFEELKQGGPEGGAGFGKGAGFAS